MFNKYENNDSTKKVMSDDDKKVISKETSYDNGSKRYLQIQNYDNEKHDTRVGYYNAENQVYVEAYHGENTSEESKKAMGDKMNETLNLKK